MLEIDNNTGLVLEGGGCPRDVVSLGDALG